MINNRIMIDNKIRIIDLTVGDLLDIIGKTPTVVVDNMPKPEKRFVYGISGIAQLFNCSTTTANRIKASGKIDRAISQCGRMIVVDADLALELIKNSTKS
jgi:hypothetical protein